MMEKNKVELKNLVMDGLVELHIQDIRSASKDPIPLALIRKAEICKSIYKRNEKVYQDNGIDYSDTGEKNIKDVEEAIIHLRLLEVERTSYEDRLRGTVFVWHFPPIDGNSTILLTDFTEDVLSLTGVPQTSIRIRLERDVIGISPIPKKEE